MPEMLVGLADLGGSAIVGTICPRQTPLARLHRPSKRGTWRWLLVTVLKTECHQIDLSRKSCGGSRRLTRFSAHRHHRVVGQVVSLPTKGTLTTCPTTRCYDVPPLRRLGLPALAERLAIAIDEVPHLGDVNEDAEVLGAAVAGMGHADQPAVVVDQRPTAVAGVDRRVGFQLHAVVHVVLTLERVEDG